MSTLKYLREKEYSMGNGQCPECCGVPPSWHGHPCHPTPQSIGHKRNCPLAAAIMEQGGSVLFQGKLTELPLGERYKPGTAYYKYINSKEYKEWAENLDKKLNDLLFEYLTKEI
jgi:hypothetical protein